VKAVKYINDNNYEKYSRNNVKLWINSEFCAM